MEDLSVAFRLKNIIEALGLTDSQFADRCSISRPTLSLLLSGKNKKISDVMLSQIHEAFPEVSILWLLFGEGQIFNKEKTGTEESSGTGDENQIFKRINQEEDEQLNLVNVKQLESIIHNVINESFNNSKKEMSDILLKISEPALLRKASKITVYYDDSTFETFIPENTKKFNV